MPIYADIIVLIFVLTPVVAAIALIRSRRRSSREAAPSTMWASAGLVVIRGSALLLLGGLLFVAVAPGTSGTSQSISDGRIELETGWYDEQIDGLRDESRMNLAVPSPYGRLELCPTRMESMESRPGVTQAVETRCWARRNLDEGYDGVDVGDWTMVKHVEDPPASVKRTFALIEVVALLGVGLMLLSLDRILVRTARRQPFAEVNVRWLRILAVGVAIVGIVHPLLEHRFADRLIVEHLGETGERAIASDGWWAVGLTPFLAVLLVLVLAEVWRFGIRLQQDAEATV